MAPPRTPGRTPGKTLDGQAKYIRYNDNPRDVGTQSHRPMPTDVPLNDDGFEDPEQFMRSPSASIMGTASRRTTMGGMSIAPSSAGTSRRVTKGRMSQLDGSDDDDDELAGRGPDDFDDMAGDTTFFGNSHPTNVNLPRRSTLGPATPTTEYDDLPSPASAKSASKRQSSAGLSRSGLRSPLTPLNHDDSMTMGSSGRASESPRSAKRPRRSVTADDDDESSTRANQKSRKSGLSALTDVDEADEQEQDDDDFYDANQDVGGDFGGDDGGVSEEDEADASLPIVQEQDEDDEEADEEEGGEGSVARSSGESGEETAVEQATYRKKIPASKKPGHKRRERIEEHVDIQQAKSARLSGMNEVGVGKFKGDFVTRSGRHHIRPLRHWAGEKVSWASGEYQAEVKEVIRQVIPEPRKLGVAAKKGRSRSRASRTRTMSVEEEPALDDGTGYDQGVATSGQVLDYRHGTEEEKVIAMPFNLLNPRTVKSGDFEYQKVFGEDSFAAAGIIRIKPQMTKSVKPSKDNTFFFFVYKGGVNVNIHRTSFNMGPGAMFMVPRGECMIHRVEVELTACAGNKYKIENLSGVDAQLFFAQTRKHAPDELELKRIALDAEEALNKSKRREDSTGAPTEAGAEPEPEPEAETPKPIKRKPGRPRKSQ